MPSPSGKVDLLFRSTEIDLRILAARELHGGRQHGELTRKTLVTSAYGRYLGAKQSAFFPPGAASGLSADNPVVT